MKTFLIASLLASTAATAVSAQALRIGMSPEPYMPLTSIDASGTWIGYEADLVNKICETIEGGCEIRQMAWEALIPSLQEGKVDAVVGGFSVTDERKQVVDFTIPYQLSENQIVGPKFDTSPLALVDSEFGQVLSAEGLERKTLGAQSASIQAIYIETYLPDVDLKTYAAADMVFSDLYAGRIDYALIGDGFGDDFLASEQGAEFEFKMVLPPNPVLGEGIAFGVSKEKPEARAAIDAILAKLTEEGTIAALQEKWGL